jgi:DNA-binding NtrC family response regulator
MNREILIVDDKEKFCKSLAENLDELGFQSYYATNGTDALEILQRHHFKAVIVDVVLGDENGLEILKRIQKVNRRIPVIMITGYASIDTAVQSIKNGAFDYIQKPVNFDKLLKTIENAIKKSELEEENVALKERIIELSPSIVTANGEMISLLEKAEKLAATDLPVLICGEHGTGKELFVDFIHTRSSRRTFKIVKMNCAAFPESLLDNELFGHNRGAYTGADSVFKGVFEQAHRSSLFLDEIGEMPFSIQTKILRAIQNKEIKRVGGSEIITVDVRFITATNMDLPTLIAEKKFRDDLFYRLNTAVLKVPPLRDRSDDIPLLVDHFLREFSSDHEKPVLRSSENLLDKLIGYRWPGNVRELKNAVYYAAAITSRDFIDIEDLPTNLSTYRRPGESENIREDMERNLILTVLKKSNNNKKKAAETLNLSRNTLYNKMRKYGLAFRHP